MSDPLEELRSWYQALADPERTIICRPEHEEMVRSAVESYDVGGLWEVVVSPYIPEGQFIIMDYPMDPGTPE